MGIVGISLVEVDAPAVSGDCGSAARRSLAGYWVASTGGVGVVARRAQDIVKDVSVAPIKCIQIDQGTGATSEARRRQLISVVARRIDGVGGGSPSSAVCATTVAGVIIHSRADILDAATTRARVRVRVIGVGEVAGATEIGRKVRRRLILIVRLIRLLG